MHTARDAPHRVTYTRRPQHRARSSRTDGLDVISLRARTAWHPHSPPPFFGCLQAAAAHAHATEGERGEVFVRISSSHIHQSKSSSRAAYLKRVFAKNRGAMVAGEGLLNSAKLGGRGGKSAKYEIYFLNLHCLATNILTCSPSEENHPKRDVFMTKI